MPSCGSRYGSVNSATPGANAGLRTRDHTARFYPGQYAWLTEKRLGTLSDRACMLHILPAATTITTGQESPEPGSVGVLV